MNAQPMPEVVHLVPHNRIPAFEAEGWIRARRFDRCHHAHWNVMMTRPGRSSDTAESILAEVQRLCGSNKEATHHAQL